jgi:hypothetical protein
MANHDYTGHNAILGLGHRSDGITLMSGRGLGIREGDTLTIKHQNNQIAKYEVLVVKYPSAQFRGDLWAVDAKFVEYVETPAG